MDLKSKKILVTGGMGFIGYRTVAALIKSGADVVIVDNLSASDKKNINSEARFYNMNISAPALEEIFKKEKPEIVYHFAFNISIHKSFEMVMGQDIINADFNLLANCQKYGVKKFIFASSGIVYGNPKDFPVTETYPIDPISPYALLKIIVENYVRFFNRTYGLDYVILRYATVYGPGQFSGAMSDYIKILFSGGQANILGDGTKTRDYVYIDDVVRANLMVLGLPNDFENPIFNIGTGVETTLNELCFKIAEILKKDAHLKYLPERPGELIRYCLDYSKIKNILGWEPEYNIEKGLRKRLKEENLI